MRTNTITFENYEAVKKEYGHIATWALWNEEAQNYSKPAFQKDAALRKELIIANTKEEFKAKKLDRVLHGDLVVLALNFSCPKEAVKNPNPILRILNEYKDEKYNRQRYEGLKQLIAEEEDYCFFNMYGPAGRNYGEGFRQSDLLHGAYMTDFIKFTREGDELLAAGIPHSNSGSDIVTKYLQKGWIEDQAEGLRRELELLGVKPKAFVLVSSKLNNERVRQAISDALGYRPQFEQLHHYTLGGSSYKNRGYDTKEAMYQAEIRQVEENIQALV